MTQKNTRLLRALARMLAIILIFSMGLVGCDNSGSKKDDSKDKQNEAQETVAKKNKSTKSKDSGKKRVAITYDDGPHNVRTNAIVDELEKYGFNATFFVVGNRVDGTVYNGKKAVKYAAEKGNEIAIHAYTHDAYYDTCSKARYNEELDNTFEAIRSVLPKAQVKLMRPVGGRITDERVESCEYSVIMWSVDSNDWKYKGDGEEGVDAIVENVTSQVKDGSIILMHDIYENTYLATKEILKWLDDEGYEVVTVSELLGNPKAGVKYSKET
ncbi:MAG: polysaccharide deacetylase family protein [Clostridia bacterium]|nr:polysaccharide deacetylase family protein [Clostridia bacterium]